MAYDIVNMALFVSQIRCEKIPIGKHWQTTHPILERHLRMVLMVDVDAKWCT